MSKIKLDKTDFFKRYNIPGDTLSKTGLDWSELEDIYSDHIGNIPNLQPTANYIADRLRQVEAVHSLKYRVKHPEHLIEKIIRKKLGDSSLEYTPSNYKERITDLIGIRALHLFKGDWERIHDFIYDTWKLKERPTANVRKGDSDEITQLFKTKGCKIKEHKFGYRSVHYLVKSQPSKNLFVAEIQVRTIFEEGWSEIDHQIRYPYDIDNPIIGQFLVVFNRLAGSSDEMGSFIQVLKKYLEERNVETKNAQEEYNKKVDELKSAIQKLEITKQKKEGLEKQLKEIASSSSSNPFLIRPVDFSKFILRLGEISLPQIKLPDFSAQISSGITVMDLAKTVEDKKGPVTSPNTTDDSKTTGKSKRVSSKKHSIRKSRKKT